MTDRTIVDAAFDRYCIAGDPEDLAAVFLATVDALRRRASTLVRRTSDIDDLVQNTYVTAIQSRHQFRVGSPALPWLLGIMRNHASTLRRATGQSPEELPDLASPGESPPSRAEEREIRAQIVAAIARLPAHYRTVVEPILLEHQSPDAVAARLNRSAATVRSQWTRGMRRLRQALPALAAAALRALGLARLPRSLGLTLLAVTTVGILIAVWQIADRRTTVSGARDADRIAPRTASTTTHGGPRPEATASESTRRALTDPRSSRSTPPTPVVLRRAGDGSPIGGLEVRWFPQADSSRFVVAPVHTTTGRVQIAQPQGSVSIPWARTTVDLGDPSAEVEAGRPTRGILLPPGFALRGEVRDAAGQPVAAALVQWADERGPLTLGRTGKDGTILMPDLSPSQRHRVRAVFGGQSSPWQLLQEASGAHIEVLFELAPSERESPTGRGTARTRPTRSTGPIIPSARDSLPPTHLGARTFRVRATDGTSLEGWDAVLLASENGEPLAWSTVRAGQVRFESPPAASRALALLPRWADDNVLRAGRGPRARTLRPDSTAIRFDPNETRPELRFAPQDLPNAAVSLAGIADAVQCVILDGHGAPRAVFQRSKASRSWRLDPLRPGKISIAIQNGHGGWIYRGPLVLAPHRTTNLAIDPRALRAHPVPLRLTPPTGTDDPGVRWTLTAADVAVRPEPRARPEDPIMLMPGKYTLYWCSDRDACTALPITLTNAPQEVLLRSTLGLPVHIQVDGVVQNRRAAFDLQIESVDGRICWRERIRRAAAGTTFRLTRPLPAGRWRIRVRTPRGRVGHGHCALPEKKEIRITAR